uniref:Myb-like domain-containing protein n=1 Tax=Brassica oleracea var. oleracea TaxID=109376 RepID=A0A0D3DQN6_BRAOL
MTPPLSPLLSRESDDSVISPRRLSSKIISRRPNQSKMRPPPVARSPSNLSVTLCLDLLDASVISPPHLSSKIISPQPNQSRMRPPRVSRSPSKFSATLWDDLLDASVISSPNLSSKIISPRRLTSMKKAFASVSEIQNERWSDEETNVECIDYVVDSGNEDFNFAEDNGGSRKERRTWTPTDDVVLISSWLNTSKDAVIGNEQRSLTFWKRIVGYYNASPKLAGCEKREATHCKNRWQKINDVVSKNDGSSRKRKCGDVSHSASSKCPEANSTDDDETTNRPPGVKAAKAGSKKKMGDGKDLSKFQTIWSIKKEDLALKEKLSKIKLLETLIAKQGPLADYEETLKQKLITELMQLFYLAVLGLFHGPSSMCSHGPSSMWSHGPSIMLLCRVLCSVVYVAFVVTDLYESFDDEFDEIFDQQFDMHFDQTFENLTIQIDQEERRKKRKKELISKEIVKKAMMSKPLFMHIVDRLSSEVDFFRQKKDGLGRLGLSALQLCTAAISVLAYGTAADTVDEYLRLGETTTRSCVENFVEGIIYLFRDEYLRRPTPADLQRLLDVGEYRGFLGMIGSIDCVHWEWKNCPTAWKGQYSRGTLNDINVLDRSPVFDDIINGQAPQVTYSVNGREYHLTYNLTDGIYPKLATFIQSISLLQGPKAVLFAQRQEAIRKDVERAFGVLQARFAIVKNLAPLWDKVKIGKIMRACIILHNMIVEDERDGNTQFDVSEFQQGEDNGSSHVDLTYSTDIPTNIANMMGVRIRIRDRQMHEQLKGDLVEHVWRKFGRDEDNQ